MSDEIIAEPLKDGIQGPQSFVVKTNYFQLLELADKDIRLQVNKLAFTGDGVVLFEVLQMDSSQRGRRFFVVYGPGKTYPTIEAAALGRLGDVPSEFAYPVAYAETPR